MKRLLAEATRRLQDQLKLRGIGLGPAHETGLTTPKVALIAAGVTIVVAIITLSGVWKTVKDKWTNDRIGDVWNRFIWLVDPARVKVLGNQERKEILGYLKRKAGRLRDADLKKVVAHWHGAEVDGAYDKLRNATEKAVTVLATIRDDKSVPPEQRQRAGDLHHSLVRSLEPFTHQVDSGVVTPTSMPTPRSPASAAPAVEISSTTSKILRSRSKPMDEATAAKLAAFESELGTLQSAAKDHIQTALAAVAKKMRKRVDEYAKTIAYQQPQMTNYLAGADKIEDLREELGTAAAMLADNLVAAASQIRWRAVQPASAAVSGFLTSHVQQFDDILESHGYYIGPRTGISPDKLFDPKDLDQVERELQNLFEKEHAAHDAQAAESRKSVDALWSLSIAIAVWKKLDVVPWIPLGPILGFVGIGLVPMQAGAKKMSATTWSADGSTYQGRLTRSAWRLPISGLLGAIVQPALTTNWSPSGTNPTFRMSRANRRARSSIPRRLGAFVTPIPTT